MMKRRPARGIVLSKPFNSTYMPSLDSLTVLCGQNLTIDCSRLASTTSLQPDVSVAGKGEKIAGSTKLRDAELPLLRSKKARTKLKVFPFMKVEFEVRNSFHRPQQISTQTAEDRTDIDCNNQPFLHTSNRSCLPGHLSLLCSGSQDLDYQRRNGLRYQDNDPQDTQGVHPGNPRYTSDLFGGDTHRSQPGIDESGQSRGPRAVTTQGRALSTSSLLADDNGGEALAVSLSEHDGMGKNKPASKRPPLKHSTRRPVTLPSSIKTSQLGKARALPNLTTPNQTARPLHKSKVKVPATASLATRSQRSSRSREKVEYAEYLPVSGPDDDLTDLHLTATMRSSTKKKERRNRKTTCRDEDLSEPTGSLSSAFVYRKRGSLTYSDGSEQSDDDQKSDISDVSTSAFNFHLPAVEASRHLSKTPRMCQVLQTISGTGTPKRGTLKKDTDYEDEQRRQQLADQRRRKQQHVYNKLKSKPWQLVRVQSDNTIGGQASFDNYDFLARYCILNSENTENYRQIFEQADDQKRGWLSQEQTAAALKEVNGRLTGTEREFLFRIMEITGYSAIDGADFRLFATLAALSQKITSLDSWMQLMVREMNLQLLEMKTFLCKRLWEVCVDPNTSILHLDHLMVELRSGGVSRRHQEQVKKQLGHRTSLDLVDFLTYSPLFIKIHQSVIENPLSDSGMK